MPMHLARLYSGTLIRLFVALLLRMKYFSDEIEFHLFGDRVVTQITIEDDDSYGIIHPLLVFPALLVVYLLLPILC